MRDHTYVCVQYVYTQVCTCIYVHVYIHHVRVYYSYMTLIGMHELHGQMHPN